MSVQDASPYPYEDYVRAGIEVIDRYGPGVGWVLRISIQSIDFPSLRTCPLGQLYGDYDRGVQLLRANGWDIPDTRVVRLARFGFVIAQTARSFPSSYGELTQEWKRQLQAKRNAELEAMP